MRTRLSLVLVWAFLALVFVEVPSSLGQAQKSEHTLSMAEGAKLAAVRIENLDWLVGRWVGEGLGGQCEEVFLPPFGNSMTGSFRYIKDGKLVFSEYYSFVARDDGIVLRLKHFTSDFIGWEKHDKSVEFPLIKLAERTAWFDGLTYKLDEDGTLYAWVVIEDKSTGKIEEAAFRFRRSSLDLDRKIESAKPNQ